MRQRDDLYADARNADAAPASLHLSAVATAAKKGTKPAASPLTSGAGASKNIYLSPTTTSAQNPISPKRNAALNSLLLDDDDDDALYGTPPESESELTRGGALNSPSSLQDMSVLMENTNKDSINSKSIAGGRGTALAIEEAIYKTADDASGDSGNIDYRMDFDDFVKVQQIDDVLVTALLKKPR